MTRPAVVTFIGVAGLVLGSYGLAKDAAAILSPWVPEWQERFIERAVAAAPKDSDPNSPVPNPAQMFREFMWNPPPWYAKWAVPVGIIGAICSGLCILGSVWLLFLHPRAFVVLASGVMGSILVGVAWVVMFLCASGLMGLTMLPGNIVGLVLDSVYMALLLTLGRPALASLAVGAEPPVVG